MNCPKCGEACNCLEPPRDELQTELADAEVAAQLAGVGEIRAGEPDDAWRDELAQRLSRYRSRRKAPPPRYPSLRLPFGKLEYPARTVSTDSLSFSGFESHSNHALALDDAQPELRIASQIQTNSEALPARISAPVQQASAKIIEFPRFAWAPPSPPPDQLAEPVGEQLRILEVPEFQPAPPALGGITIEPVETEPIEKRLGIDMPVHIAPLSRRLAASAFDGLIIAFAFGLFGFVFWKVAGVRPPGLQFLSIAGGSLAVFWAVYQYLLIVYSGSTPGLRVAGLELTRFDGSATSRSLRRWRILASYLSALSLGMGYAWAFLDEDSLCWHDRITGTHCGVKKRTALNH
jgi:hypothetical protein